VVDREDVRALHDRPLTEPRQDRLDRTHPQAAAALEAHATALDLGQATYRDPISGYRVLTARTLADRGTCCGLGCRHCPYAPEPDGTPG
jgi:hypothetical protein